MMHDNANPISTCGRTAEIFACLDGELTADEELRLEVHLAACPACRDEFNLQKKLLNVLSSAVTSGDDLVLPENFAKVVVANAESNVSGIRKPRELGVSVMISAAILFVAVVIAVIGGFSFGGFGPLLEKAGAVLLALFHLFYSFALGVSVMIRSLTSGVGSVFAPAAVLLLIGTVIFCLAIFYFRSSRSRSA